MCPVADHAVHPKTVERPNARYGCFDRPPFRHGYLAPNGYKGRQYSTAEVAFRLVLHTMSRDCQYDMAATDRKCAGCRHIKGD